MSEHFRLASRILLHCRGAFSHGVIIHSTYLLRRGQDMIEKQKEKELKDATQVVALYYYSKFTISRGTISYYTAVDIASRTLVYTCFDLPSYYCLPLP